MAKTLAEKIIEAHLVEGVMKAGEEITLKIDHVLLQDATGTMAWLEFEAMDIAKVKPELVVQYIDHNLMQADSKNMDDHLFLITMTSKYGARCSLPGNGISHHVHKERFTKPGKTMVGADSHTPSSGGSGMLAVGVGGLDAAVAMATGEYTVPMPEIVNVQLTGELRPWCTAMDVVLEILRRFGVDGGLGKILEFTGSGVATLTVEERSTIANMGAETGATTSLFPSDEMTRSFFKAQKREKDWIEMKADEGVRYADTLEINLSNIVPLVACPHSPGNVKTLEEVAGTPIGQAMIGSSTNSSYESFVRVMKMLEHEQPEPTVAMHAIPGSRQLLETLARDEALVPLLKAGVRIAEPSCNACIGMGNAPASKINSIRSFPRNWEGRSGAEHDFVYLASPETVAASALMGEISDPRELQMAYPAVEQPQDFVIDDKMVLPPTFRDEVRRGPNIKKIEFRIELEDVFEGAVLIKVGDDISTDHILRAGADVLPLRSNIPEISKHVFEKVDEDFYRRAREHGGGFVVGGKNYGQGSSREHAAIGPMYLSVKAVLAKKFARIHRKNLINFGIVPFEFLKDEDYEELDQDDELRITNVGRMVKEGAEKIEVKNLTKKKTFTMRLNLSERERHMLTHGGLLNCIRKHAQCEKG